MSGALNSVARFDDGGWVEQQRMQKEPYYDPALAMRTARLLGPGFQAAYAPSRKRFIKTDFPLNTAGLYVLPNDKDPQTHLYPYTKSGGEEIYDILKPTPDTVYSFGVTPSATTLSHEYRHRAGIAGERSNRLYDAMYAETDEDWAEAVKYWRDWMRRDSGKDVSKETAEDSLLRTLRDEEVGLRRREWETAPENAKPVLSDPTVLGWLSQMLGPRDAYANRAPSNFEKFAKDKANGGLAVLDRRR